MNRKAFLVSLLAATSVIALASCGNKGDSTTEAPTSSTSVAPVPEEVVEVTKINLNRLNVGLIVTYDSDGAFKSAESCQLSYETLPRKAVKAKLKWSSSDPSVATVDANGLVTAVKEGAAVITAKSWNEQVQTTCNVHVAAKCTKSKANSTKTAIQNAQKEAQMAEKLDKIQVTELFDYSRTKNGNIINQNYYFQDTYVSKSEGYFRITSDDKYIKTEGGSSSFKYTEWVIYTTKDYDTYLFHVNGPVKTYMIADTTSAISEGLNRYEAMLTILDNLFTSGSGIVTGSYPDCLGEDELKQIKTAARAGTSKDDELIFSYGATYRNEEAGLEEESDEYIPAGTLYDLSINFDCVVENNKMLGKHIVQSMDYKLENDKYSNVYDIEYNYKTEGVELYYPDKADFTKVESIFDL